MKEKNKGFMPGNRVKVDVSRLARNNSYGVPEFVKRGFYIDIEFICAKCGKDEVWKAIRQKWWYEVAGGFAYSTAVHCSKCRRELRRQANISRTQNLEKAKNISIKASKRIGKYRKN